MPKDFEGNQIKRGDIVLVPCEVLFTQPYENRNNLTVRPLHGGDRYTGRTHMALMGIQVIKKVDK